MNFIRDNIFLICVALYCIGALVWPYIRKGAKITNSQATKIINKGKTAIIDIRDQKQYQAGHILNAVHGKIQGTTDHHRGRIRQGIGQGRFHPEKRGIQPDQYSQGRYDRMGR